jgi:hypothetical protein
MHHLTWLRTFWPLAPVLVGVVVGGCQPIASSSPPLPEPGTCVVYVANDVASQMDPVPCSQPHTHVIVGTAPRDACPVGTDAQVATVTEKGVVFCLRSVLADPKPPLGT